MKLRMDAIEPPRLNSSEVNPLAQDFSEPSDSLGRMSPFLRHGFVVMSKEGQVRGGGLTLITA
jgi:hypothetical protein